MLLTHGFAVQKPLVLDGITVTVVNSIPGSAIAALSNAPEGPLPPVVKKAKPKLDKANNKPKPPKQSKDGTLPKTKPQPSPVKEASSNADTEQRSQAERDRKVTDLRRLLNTVEQLRSEKRTKEADIVAQKRASEESDLAKVKKALDTILTEKKTVEAGAQEASLGNGFTSSDFDRLKNQLVKCWNIPVGAQGVQDITVALELRVDKSGYVKKLDIIDPDRLSDPVYRVLAESVMRAVWHPDCTPLLVPAVGHEKWQTLILTFDPSWLLTG